MPLFRRPAPFSHPEWVYEIKHDGFRALVYLENRNAHLVSRRGHVYRSFPVLCDSIRHDLKAADAILDGEIVCVDAEGRSQFNHLLYRRGEPYFYTFDLLWLNGRDFRKQPLLSRKKKLCQILPSKSSRLLYLDHIAERGNELYDLVCQRDLEGMVAKWAHGPYLCDGRTTNWVKVKNPAYSQIVGRDELFAHRGLARHSAPVLANHI